MCGIFGITATTGTNLSPSHIRKIFTRLFLLSESRGKEASGYAFQDLDQINVYKCPSKAANLIKSDIYKEDMAGWFSGNISHPVTLIGHSRLVTGGLEQFNRNNQPVVKNGVVGVHNGIIVNEDELWKNYPHEQRETELDSELIFTLLQKFYIESASMGLALQNTFKQIEGMASVAALFGHLDNLLLGTNNGSLYYLQSEDSNSLVFASEWFILESLIKQNYLKKTYKQDKIKKLDPGFAALVDLRTGRIDSLNFYEPINNDFSTLCLSATTGKINDRSTGDSPGFGGPEPSSSPNPQLVIPRQFIETFSSVEEKVALLRRCKKCILPETVPFLWFDNEGVCNYCNNYKHIVPKGIDALVELVDRFRRTNNKPDNLVAFSGGRDSSFLLHFIKKELGLNPLAYSYDWGMITDLARRNQARLCGKLGVEHILVSADLRKKRANIRKNVLAWLKRPRPGTIPLFMAGDKQYFYYANKVMKQNRIQLVFLGENLLETTNFKSGFCGVSPVFDKEHTYTLPTAAKTKMVLFYAKEYIMNTAYLNSSLTDTFGAFISYYSIPHNYINFYDYIPWDEKEIDSTLIDQYGWETSPDTNTTWRIGDGTAAFYNYIYYIIAGFTENDTFRSNQIREGMLTRDDALSLVQEENKPRYNSLRWYCNTIGVDFEETMNRIITIPGLYEKKH